MAEKPFAFVLMPFSSDFDDIYKLGIQAAAADRGIVAERVDEQRFSESILERVYRQIKSADLIIADMTGKNANVFYEVGYAHANDKLCTLLTQSVDDIPFDLKYHRHIVYGKSIQNLRSSLTADLDWMISQLERRKNSSIAVEIGKSDGNLINDSWQSNVDVQLLLDIHNRTTKKSPDIESIYLHTRPEWKIFQGSEECSSTKSEQNNGLLKHFLRSPVLRLSPGAWGQLNLVMKRQVWNKYSGDGEKPVDYRAKGNLVVEVYTSEGTFSQEIYLDVDCQEFPF